MVLWSGRVLGQPHPELARRAARHLLQPQQLQQCSTPQLAIICQALTAAGAAATLKPQLLQPLLHRASRVLCRRLAQRGSGVPLSEVRAAIAVAWCGMLAGYPDRRLVCQLGNAAATTRVRNELTPECLHQLMWCLASCSFVDLDPGLVAGLAGKVQRHVASFSAQQLVRRGREGREKLVWPYLFGCSCSWLSACPSLPGASRAPNLPCLFACLPATAT